MGEPTAEGRSRSPRVEAAAPSPPAAGLPQPGPLIYAPPVIPPEVRLNRAAEEARRALALIEQEQDIQASKQLVVRGWPEEGFSRKDRHEFLEEWLGYTRANTESVSLQTIVTGGYRCAHFTIMEFFDKEARESFRRAVVRELSHFGVKVGGKDYPLAISPQIPKYQRDRDQAFRCCMRAAAEAEAVEGRMSVVWDLRAAWNVGKHPRQVHQEESQTDPTHITMHVAGDVAKTAGRFAELWPEWGSGAGKGKGKDGVGNVRNKGRSKGKTQYRPQDFLVIHFAALTARKADEINEKYMEHSGRAQGTSTTARTTTTRTGRTTWTPGRAAASPSRPARATTRRATRRARTSPA